MYIGLSMDLKPAAHGQILSFAKSNFSGKQQKSQTTKFARVRRALQFIIKGILMCRQDLECQLIVLVPATHVADYFVL